VSDLEKQIKKAKMFSNLQRGLSYFTYFLIFGLLIINGWYFLNNWWARFNLLSLPAPYPSLAIFGLILLAIIIIFQIGLIYQLYKLKKEALKNKSKTEK
jgi:TRAP-type C4-dicarboxylate transport system permease small subunit